MTIVANTLLTYDQIGIREDLSDTIYNISPEDTPFMNMAGRVKVKNKLFEWQTDALAAVDASNWHLEGDDVTTFPATAVTTRMGNYAQISRKLLILADSDEAVTTAGRRSELAYQLAKRSAELKRDMETMALANTAGVAGNSTTERRTASLAAWIQTNSSFGAGGADSTYASGVPTPARTNGTQRAFTEVILQAVAEAVWTAGGKMRILMVGPFNKGVASAFSGVATKNYDLSGTPRPTAIIGSADVYVSEWGVLNIIPNRFQAERDAWLIDPEFVNFGFLRTFRVVKLAKTGDAEKRMLINEWGLMVKQEAALGLCADLNVS